MNKQKQIIALAEFEGYQWKWAEYIGKSTFVGDSGKVIFTNQPDSYWSDWILTDTDKRVDVKTIFGLPNYLEDLNAIHRLEKKLRGTDKEYHTNPEIYHRWQKYVSWIMQSYGISANAPERAELILKIIEKWEED